MLVMNDQKLSLPDAVLQISQHQPFLLAYILAMHPNHCNAQDILQETNIVLLEKIDTFQDGTSFKAWACRVAYLQTLAHFKRVKRGSWLGFHQELVEAIAQESVLVLEDFEVRHRALRHCIDRLPQSDREIIAGYYSNSLSLSELSGKAGRSVGALKQVLMRIRRSLKMCIEGQVSAEAHS